MHQTGFSQKPVLDERITSTFLEERLINRSDDNRGHGGENDSGRLEVLVAAVKFAAVTCRVYATCVNDGPRRRSVATVIAVTAVVIGHRLYAAPHLWRWQRRQRQRRVVCRPLHSHVFYELVAEAVVAAVLMVSTASMALCCMLYRLPGCALQCGGSGSDGGRAMFLKLTVMCCAM